VTAEDRRPDAARQAAAQTAEGRGPDAAREAAARTAERPDAARKSARLRPMSPADLAGVIALEHELFPEDPWTPQMFADEVAQPAEVRLYLVAEADDGPAERNPAADPVPDPGPGSPIAGYAGMLFVPGGLQADVLTIAVSESRWGLGIGSALLDALIQAARERDCAEVFLEVRADNPRAHGLYQRRGFAEIGVRRGYYKPSGVDAIVMRKDLLR
jgi:[ribosomal protein S18]-alanine N-acetyltransferase